MTRKETPTQRVLRALEDKEVTLEQINTAMDEVERESQEQKDKDLKTLLLIATGAAFVYIAIHIVVAYARG